MTENIQEIIERSGNVFHYQVINFLREKGWSVLVSPFYNDNATDKPREIDIIAEKEYQIGYSHDWVGTLNVKLFIECKYVNQPTIFWFDNKDEEKTVARIIKDTGMPSSFDNTEIKSHRFYGLNNVAKLFASGKENQENELIFKAINQSLNAMIYFQNGKTIIPKKPHQVSKVKRTLHYPVILCKNFDNFYTINVSNADSTPNALQNNFNLEINYAYLDSSKDYKTDYFLIDVVSFEEANDFLKSLEEKDVALVRNYINFHEMTRR